MEEKKKDKIKIESPWSIAFHKLIKNKLSIVSAIILFILIFMALAADAVTPFEYNDMDLKSSELPPNLNLYRVDEDNSIFYRNKDKKVFHFTSNGHYVTDVPFVERDIRNSIFTYELDGKLINVDYSMTREEATKGEVEVSIDGELLDTHRTWNKTYLLGTDKIGRDMFTRIVHGSRISLSVGIVAVSIRVFIGIILGSISGFYGGKIDTLIMRFAEMVMCFPFLLIAISLVVILGPSIYNVMLVLGLLGWPGIARIVRAQILSLKEQEFMEATEALGIRDSRKIFKHLLPNVMSSVIVFATMGMAGAILTEAALSFLGLGVQPPRPSWGNMIQAARSLYALENQWWLWIPPGLSIFITVISFNLLGDGLRDALDPKLNK